MISAVVYVTSDCVAAPFAPPISTRLLFVGLSSPLTRKLLENYITFGDTEVPFSNGRACF